VCRAAGVKLADRLHNMQTIAYLRPDSQQRKSHESLTLLAPVAGRLGYSEVKEQLEDLALATLLRTV
jgi:(p)ppGpp synthase/HD superfamily hydrolase